MSDQAVLQAPRRRRSPIKQAVYRSRTLSRQGVLERLFALVFDNLVYPQIWEDPRLDMRALEIGPSHHLVAIASGGCNVLSYLTADPARITAVDLNPAHLALTRLKLAALAHLPCQEDFQRFFADAKSPLNPDLYELFIARHLDPETRAYWSGNGAFRPRRIALFANDFYRHGMLGRFITLAHFVARAHGANPASLMQAETLEQQREFFDHHLAPLFDRKTVRLLCATPISLFGLGIPPAQYRELAEGRHMADVLRERVEKLACDFPLRDNYFARQAFGRSYEACRPGVSLPPYLQAANWKWLRQRCGRVETVNRSVSDVLADAPPESVDRIVLLDAQDWMNDRQINALWRAIGHAAAPGARVIFRTAGKGSPLETRLAENLRAQWHYEEEFSRQFTREDRSAIYGGFHLYVRAR
jgi:S-adenosylmethionine-diacylglycerol 3-amino-3-carboxypropyl transferase